MERSPGRAWRAWLARAAMTSLVLVVAGCAIKYPQTTLHPRSDITRLIDSLFRTTFWWAVAVFILVEGALLWAMYRFRAKPNDPEPEQNHGNTTLEIVWTIIPAVILAFIAVPTVRTIFKTSLPAVNPQVEVEVIGHQWWWEYRYPKLGVVTANELVVPVGKMINLRMWSADVLHSWWSPQLAAKRDVFPIFPKTRNKKVNPLWFTADSVGDYTGQCAELCGIQHGRMGLRVLVKSEADFQQWVAGQRVGSPTVNAGKVEAAVDSAWKADTIYTKGLAAFSAGGCLTCHAMAGTPLASALTLRGPNLSHLGSRTTIGANMFENTPTNLAAWLRDPQGPLTEAEISALVAYLRLHQ
jgi:cytochrome c oxidase subunit 2